MRRFSRRQDVWFHVNLPFVQAVGAPQGEVDEIGLAGQRARAELGAGAKATRGTTERFRRVGWVEAIRSIVHAPSSTARTRPRRCSGRMEKGVTQDHSPDVQRRCQRGFHALSGNGCPSLGSTSCLPVGGLCTEPTASCVRRTLGLKPCSATRASFTRAFVDRKVAEAVEPLRAPIDELESKVLTSCKGIWTPSEILQAGRRHHVAGLALDRF